MIKKYVSFIIYPKLAIWVLIGFIGFTVVGTLTHELGHIAFAKAQGYETSLHYGWMNYKNGPDHQEFEKIWNTYETEIKTGKPYPEKQRRQELLLEMQYRSNWITFGGPFQTILTGTLGVLLLYRRRKRIQKSGMKLIDWLYTFLALFWLRELANPITALIISTLRGKPRLFGGRGDELNLARSLGWWEGSISLPLAVIAIGVAFYVIFKILPKPLRLTFISAGLVGGVFGYMIWLVWIGPVLMP